MSDTLAALVTGGGSGIGRAISLRLAKEMPVLLVGRTPNALATTASQIVEQGGVAEILPLDITAANAGGSVGDKLNELGWSIKTLVLNAGRGLTGPTERQELDQFRSVYEVNLFSALPLLKVVVPGMRQRKSGAIVFISSTAGLKGIGFDAAYASSKAAIISFARCLADEYGPDGISVVPVCPWFVEGDATERSIQSIARRRGISAEEARTFLEGKSPQKRIIPAAEVADTVAFVASGPLSLSGHPIVLSGGLS